jgi:zinc/manganese transport system substrate-binding protein
MGTVTRTFLWPLLAALASLLAPLNVVHAAPDRPLQVVVSFTILGDWVRIIGAEEVSVQTLVGPDADAHVYEPTPADVRQVAAAELLIVNGLAFEGWMSRLAESAGFKGRLLVASRGVRARLENGRQDPHAWQDLHNVETYVRNIGEALQAARPNAAAAIATRMESYLREIAALGAESRRQIDTLPRADRVVLTSHDAFGYLADTYHLTLFAAQGFSTDSEPSAAAVGALIRQLRTQHVRAVFVENIRDPRLIERIAAEGGVTVGGRLYSDALGAPGTPAATFIGMYRSNIATLVRGMKRQSPIHSTRASP